MRARAQLGWMIRGAAATRGAIDDLATDLRELQQKVAVLQTALDEIRRDQLRLGERQLDELDVIRAAVAATTDDLTARVNALDARTRVER